MAIQSGVLGTIVRSEDTRDSRCATADIAVSRSGENGAQPSPYSFPRPKNPKARDLTRLCRACQSVLTDLHEWIHVAGSVNEIPEECLLAAVTDWLVANMMGSTPSPIEFFLPEEDESQTGPTQRDATSGLSGAPDSETFPAPVLPREPQVSRREILGKGPRHRHKVPANPKRRKYHHPSRGRHTSTKTIELLLGVEGSKRSVVRCKLWGTRCSWVFRSSEQARHFAYDLAGW